MDWKLLATTFGAVFVAELGDKTQLATLSLSSGKVNRLTVFLGSASALVCTSLIAVLAGDIISRYVPPQYIRRGAGADLHRRSGCSIFFGRLRRRRAGGATRRTAASFGSRSTMMPCAPTWQTTVTTSIARRPSRASAARAR